MASSAKSIATYEVPGFDLDDYIKDYTGISRIRRLVYIAQRCAAVRVTACRRAIELLKRGVNHELYVECVSMARDLLGNELGDSWGLDSAWVENTSRAALEKTNRLDAALVEAKKNGEAYAILQAYFSYADHLTKTGELSKAQTKYLEGKSYLEGDGVGEIQICQRIMELSIFLGSFTYVKNQATRAQSFPVLKTKPVVSAQVGACLGLFYLHNSSYAQAASHFLSIPMCIEGKYSEVLSATDIATYGTLCSLASFSRVDVKNKIAGSDAFKKFLDLVPEWKKIVGDLLDSNYAACFHALSRLKPRLMLDLYLGPHVEKLCARVMDKGLVQYFRPFTSVRIPKMAAAFAISVPDMETALVHLISDNKLQARIDSQSKVLYAKHADERNATFQQSLAVGTKYVSDVQNLLMRSSLVKNNFCVRPPSKGRRAEDGKETDEYD